MVRIEYCTSYIVPMRYKGMIAVRSGTGFAIFYRSFSACLFTVKAQNVTHPADRVSESRRLRLRNAWLRQRKQVHVPHVARQRLSRWDSYQEIEPELRDS